MKNDNSFLVQNELQADRISHRFFVRFRECIHLPMNNIVIPFTCRPWLLRRPQVDSKRNFMRDWRIVNFTVRICVYNMYKVKMHACLIFAWENFAVFSDLYGQLRNVSSTFIWYSLVSIFRLSLSNCHAKKAHLGESSPSFYIHKLP